MAIPKRFEEIVEEQTAANVELTFRHGPLRWKTGGVAPDAITVNALVDNVKVGTLMATNDGTGNYVLDTVIVLPEYRRRGIAMAMMHKAHASVPMKPYYLTDNPVYQSEAGRNLGYKELSVYGNGAEANNVRMASIIHTAGPLALVPELLGGAAADVAGTAAADVAGTAAADVAGTAAPAVSIAADTSGYTGAMGGAASDAAGSSGSGLWSKLKGFATKPVSQFAAGMQADKFINGTGNGFGLGSHIPPTIGPYGGTGGGGGPVQVKRMLSSKQANPIETAIIQKIDQQDKLLTMILETICRCGEPTAGMFNGMPHCMPGTGCATNIAMSPTNPSGDACCSCGNPQCSGSFHGQPICAPGQGCNDHWEPGVGRKWNPIMESPEEKIADHDHWASETNHGQFEMPEHHQTTWQ